MMYCPTTSKDEPVFIDPFLPDLEELSVSCEKSNRRSGSVSPTGPLSEFDRFKYALTTKHFPATEPQGPGHVGSTSSSSSGNFPYSCLSAHRSASHALEDFEILPTTSWKSVPEYEERILPDIDKLHSWGVFPGTLKQPQASQASLRCVGPKGTDGLGWHSTLRVGVETLSAILIVDHGEIRDNDL